jgi:hypothetical protein
LGPCSERKKALDVLAPIYDWFTRALTRPTAPGQDDVGELRPLQH